MVKRIFTCMERTKFFPLRRGHPDIRNSMDSLGWRAWLLSKALKLCSGQSCLLTFSFYNTSFSKIFLAGKKLRDNFMQPRKSLM